MFTYMRWNCIKSNNNFNLEILNLHYPGHLTHHRILFRRRSIAVSWTKAFNCFQAKFIVFGKSIINKLEYLEPCIIIYTKYFGHSTINKTSPSNLSLPWDFISTSVARSLFFWPYKKMLHAAQSPPLHHQLQHFKRLASVPKKPFLWFIWSNIVIEHPICTVLSILLCCS